MADIKNLELTKDPLTNISLMVPMLDDRSREAISYLIYGYYLGESSKVSQRDKQLQEV